MQIDKMAPHYKAITRRSVDLFESKRPFLDYPCLCESGRRSAGTLKTQPDSRSVFAAIEMGTSDLLLLFFFLFVRSPRSFPPAFVFPTKSKGLENSA